MTYDDLIKQWFSRATLEEDMFTKFIFLYIAFVAFLTVTGKGANDRRKIESVKNSFEAEIYYMNLLRIDTELNKVVKELIEELKTQPISNSTGMRDFHWIGQDGVIENEHDWKNLVEFWYRVRNNLFHGHKAPEFERDKKLVRFAYLTLFPLMQNFIQQDLNWRFD